MVFGTFDKLHPGHLDVFRQARLHGDYLTVILALDETVKKVKKRYPSQNEQHRLHQLEKLPIVDHARFGYSDDHLKVIVEEEPQIICLGYDQKFLTEDIAPFLEQYDFNIDVIRLQPFKPEVYKSSKMK